MKVPGTQGGIRYQCTGNNIPQHCPPQRVVGIRPVSGLASYNRRVSDGYQAASPSHQV